MLFGLFKGANSSLLNQLQRQFMEAIEQRDKYAAIAKDSFDKSHEWRSELIKYMNENERLKQQLANAGLNDGGTCNATGPVMTDQKHTEAYQKHILGMFGNG